MAKAYKGRHLEVTATNVRGEGAAVFDALGRASVNVTASCMYGADEDTARFWLLPDDFDKARKALRKAGYHVRTKHVVLVAMENKTGAFADVLRRVADAGVDCMLSYASAAVKSAVLVVLTTSADARAIRAINRG
jgi:hypothetical protein